jgi:hypothetical protein
MEKDPKFGMFTQFSFFIYFDVSFFLELIVTNALGVFHWISYIRYGFQVKLDFSKTGAWTSSWSAERKEKKEKNNNNKNKNNNKKRSNNNKSPKLCLGDLNINV